jgi:hypothetical protein
MTRTVTLADNVDERLEAEAQRTGVAAEEIVNFTLRRSLQETEIQPRPFTIRPRSMGPMTGLNLDCTERLLNESEGPNWK